MYSFILIIIFVKVICLNTFDYQLDKSLCSSTVTSISLANTDSTPKLAVILDNSLWLLTAFPADWSAVQLPQDFGVAKTSFARNYYNDRSECGIYNFSQLVVINEKESEQEFVTYDLMSSQWSEIKSLSDLDIFNDIEKNRPIDSVMNWDSENILVFQGSTYSVLTIDPRVCFTDNTSTSVTRIGPHLIKDISTSDSIDDSNADSLQIRGALRLRNENIRDSDTFELYLFHDTSFSHYGDSSLDQSKVISAYYKNNGEIMNDFFNCDDSRRKSSTDSDDNSGGHTSNNDIPDDNENKTISTTDSSKTKKKKRQFPWFVVVLLTLAIVMSAFICCCGCCYLRKKFDSNQKDPESAEVEQKQSEPEVPLQTQTNEDVSTAETPRSPDTTADPSTEATPKESVEKQETDEKKESNDEKKEENDQKEAKEVKEVKEAKSDEEMNQTKGAEDKPNS